jgi:hypothetical protein
MAEAAEHANGLFNRGQIVQIVICKAGYPVWARVKAARAETSCWPTFGLGALPG